MFHRQRRRAGLGLAAALLLTLSGCTSSQGGAQEQAPTGGAAAGVADTEPMSVAMVTHAAPGDTFWDQIQRGAEAAAAKDNVDLIYSSSPEGPEQATLVQNAIDQGVDGIAVTLAKPEAMESVVQQAVEAGIPVVALNSGLEQWQDMGVAMYFGQDERIAGQAVGERLNEGGAQRALCVIQEQGHVGLEARCAGVADTFQGTVENLYVTGTDMPSVRSTIQAKLQQDPSIDRVVTLGAPFALTATQSVEAAGSNASVVTFDTNPELLNAIQAGDVLWAVDQQPFVQGYMAVDSLWLQNNYGASVGGGQPVLTGPAFIDEDNIDAVLESAG
jgi:simple sugar transport system substrate-binding protein